MNAKRLIPSLLALSLGLLGWPTLSPGQAMIKCWTNADGVRECANSLPPEAAQGDYEKRRRSGTTIDTVRAARPKTEIEAERERVAGQAELAREQARKQREQERRDQVLLHTFASEAELLSARDGQLDALDSRMQHTGAVVKVITKKMRSLELEAARAERAGKTIEDALLTDIDDNLAQILQQLSQIDELAVERTQLEERFAHDLERYRALSGS